MDNKNIVNFTAKIDTVLFYNEENNYHIMQFSTNQKIPNLKYCAGKYVGTLVGYCVQCIEGDTCNVKAECVIHPKYGYQYKIISLNYDHPMDAKSMYVFLSAILTEAQATILYNTCPDIVDKVLINNKYVPDLKNLPGIGEKTWIKIRDKIINNLGYSELITLLSPVGCTLTTIKSIAKGEKDLSLLKKKIMDNPYLLCEVPHMGFKKVDKFAIKLNPYIEYSEQRVYACIDYILKKIADEDGHCFISIDDLKIKIKELVSDKEILSIVDNVINIEFEKTKNNQNSMFYVDENTIGSIIYKRMEQFILDKLINIQNTYNIWELTYKDFFKCMEMTSKKQGFCLSNEQAEAVRSISEKNITIISGKAGTGKTSVIKAILEVYKGHHIGMAALSAKAAKRMREVTGFSTAQTIHRLLQYNGVGFEYNDSNHLPYDLLILDECSMNNINLFYAILKATNNNTKIVMAGDFCQLSAIGVGSVFFDLVKHNIFNNHLLTQVYRQSEDSFINEHANIVREGIMPFSINQGRMQFGTDVNYFFRNESSEIVQDAVDVYIKFLEYVNIEDITIVVPRKDSVLVSCLNINNKIQDKLLKDEKRFIEYNDKIFKVGCRVINKKNDYEKGILNGELGHVISVSDDGMLIQFDEGNVVEFRNAELDNIELGYAISVHSSQGSQYKVTIIALDWSSYTLLTSNMMYTAMTRASDMLVVIAQPSPFKKCVTNVQEHYRNTYLKILLPKVNIDDMKSKIKEHTKQHYCLYNECEQKLCLYIDNNLNASSFIDLISDSPF